MAPGPRPGVDRRQFLRLAVVAGGLAGLAACGAPTGSSSSRRTRRTTPATTRPVPGVSEVLLPNGVRVPTARWLVEENARPGTLGWVVTGVQSPHDLEGYANRVSAVSGDEVVLYVNTVARSVSVQAYRMGYYQGLGGRLVFEAGPAPGQQQAAAEVAPGVNTVSCPWAPTLSFTVDDRWPPGCYLLKLVGDGGQQQYIPLTVRDDASTASFVLQNSVTTWQAYNLWGGYSLYYGQRPGGGRDFANRARIVSFDRPYPQTWAQGSADFFGNEFPVLYQMESLGLDMTYWTDVDLHERPQLLAGHRCLLSLGHDEYWSSPMRNGATTALSAGTNLVFLGANACYRQIRLADSPVGPNRLQICYKSAAEDPISATDPSLTTVNWDQPPLNAPESEFIGSMYQSVGANDDLVVVDPGAWVFAGCDLGAGQVIPKVVQGEYDRFVPGGPGPANVDVFAHSPVAGQRNWSDITYYTQPGGGGVLDTGSAAFVNKLSNTTAFPWNIVPKAIPGVTDVLLRMMVNVYGTLGLGPGSQVQPSTGNGTAVYGGAVTAPTPPPASANASQ